MDHEPHPRPPALRWLLAVLLLVAGGAGPMAIVEADEVTRAEASVVVDHESSRRATRRRVAPRRLPRHVPGVLRRRMRLLTSIAARLRPLLVSTRRGPPRTPCVVALS